MVNHDVVAHHFVQLVRDPLGRGPVHEALTEVDAVLWHVDGAVQVSGCGGMMGGTRLVLNE